MRGAWKISEVKDLEALQKHHADHREPAKQPFMDAVKRLATAEAKRQR